MVSLIIGWEKFYWQELIGFILLVMGTLVYNEIVILPIEALSKNTRERILEREGKTTVAQEGQNPQYMASSP